MTRFEKVFFLALLVYFVLNSLLVFKMIKWFSQPVQPIQLEIKSSPTKSVGGRK